MVISVPDHFRVEIIKRGSASFQNKDGSFSFSARWKMQKEMCANYNRVVLQDNAKWREHSAVMDNLLTC